MHTKMDVQSCLELVKLCSSFIGTDSVFKTMPLPMGGDIAIRRSGCARRAASIGIRCEDGPQVRRTRPTLAAKRPFKASDAWAPKSSSGYERRDCLIGRFSRISGRLSDDFGMSLHRSEGNAQPPDSARKTQKMSASSRTRVGRLEMRYC